MNEPSRPPAPAQTFKTEKTRLSLPLLGFYTSCAGVSLGAAVAACGFIWLKSTLALGLGICMILVCCATCYLCLRKARQ